MVSADTDLRNLMAIIASRDSATAIRQLAADPALANARLTSGATRQAAQYNFITEISHYVMSGDTALHVAAAAYSLDTIRALLVAGADIRARNRLGSEPLHYATSGNPNSPRWNPEAQAAAIELLISAGADPNALNKNGVAPLHQAVRNRCAAAVAALLDGGADSRLPNKAGSNPMFLATHTTGRGGSGTPEAKAQQAQIISLLAAHGA